MYVHICQNIDAGVSCYMFNETPVVRILNWYTIDRYDGLDISKVFVKNQ